MDVFGYCRVSTAQQREEGYSLEEQQKRIEAYCEAMDWHLLKVYVDGGESGAKLNRPALTDMIDHISAAQKVVVYKLDRLSRSQKDTLYLIEDVFLKNGCDFVSITENFDTSTPFGKAMVGILAVFAQLERETIRMRLEMGREARAKAGKHSGVSPALGYDYIDGKLIANEDREQTQLVFDLACQGMSHARIAEEMNFRGYSLHGRPWHRVAVTRLIQNPVFIGKVNWNKEHFDGDHESIVSEEKFKAANDILARRREKYKHSAGSPSSYFGGMIRCAKCGGAFYQRTETHSQPRYVCTNRVNGSGENKCMNKRWPVKEFDEIILSEARKLVLKPPKVEQVKPRDYSGELAKLDAQLLRLIDLYSLGSVPADVLENKISKLNEQKMKLLNEQKRAPRDITPALRSFDDVFSRGSLLEIRAVLQELIDHIEVDDDDIKIFWSI